MSSSAPMSLHRQFEKYDTFSVPSIEHPPSSVLPESVYRRDRRRQHLRLSSARAALTNLTDRAATSDSLSTAPDESSAAVEAVLDHVRRLLKGKLISPDKEFELTKAQYRYLQRLLSAEPELHDFFYEELRHDFFSESNTLCIDKSPQKPPHTYVEKFVKDTIDQYLNEARASSNARVRDCAERMANSTGVPFFCFTESSDSDYSPQSSQEDASRSGRSQDAKAPRRKTSSGRQHPGAASSSAEDNEEQELEGVLPDASWAWRDGENDEQERRSIAVEVMNSQNLKRMEKRVKRVLRKLPVSMLVAIEISAKSSVIAGEDKLTKGACYAYVWRRVIKTHKSTGKMRYEPSLPRVIELLHADRTVASTEPVAILDFMDFIPDEILGQITEEAELDGILRHPALAFDLHSLCKAIESGRDQQRNLEDKGRSRSNSQPTELERRAQLARIELERKSGKLGTAFHNP